MCNSHNWWCCFIPKTLNKLQTHKRLPFKENENDRNKGLLLFSEKPFSFSSIAMILFLIVCLPFLLPLFCATCPFFFAVEICFVFVRRRRRRRKVRRCGGGDRPRVLLKDDDVELLLHRYLDDQLLLVVGSEDECDGDDDDHRVGDFYGVDAEYCESSRPIMQ